MVVSLVIVVVLAVYLIMTYNNLVAVKNNVSSSITNRNSAGVPTMAATIGP